MRGSDGASRSAHWGEARACHRGVGRGMSGHKRKGPIGWGAAGVRRGASGTCASDALCCRPCAQLSSCHKAWRGSQSVGVWMGSRVAHLSAEQPQGTKHQRRLHRGRRTPPRRHPAHGAPRRHRVLWRFRRREMRNHDSAQRVCAGGGALGGSRGREQPMPQVPVLGAVGRVGGGGGDEALQEREHGGEGGGVDRAHAPQEDARLRTGALAEERKPKDGRALGMLLRPGHTEDGASLARNPGDRCAQGRGKPCGAHADAGAAPAGKTGGCVQSFLEPCMHLPPCPCVRRDEQRLPHGERHRLEPDERRGHQGAIQKTAARRNRRCRRGQSGTEALGPAPTSAALRLPSPPAGAEHGATAAPVTHPPSCAQPPASPAAPPRRPQLRGGESTVAWRGQRVGQLWQWPLGGRSAIRRVYLLVAFQVAAEAHAHDGEERRQQSSPVAWRDSVHGAHKGVEDWRQAVQDELGCPRRVGGSVGRGQARPHGLQEVECGQGVQGRQLACPVDGGGGADLRQRVVRGGDAHQKLPCLRGHRRRPMAEDADRVEECGRVLCGCRQQHGRVGEAGGGVGLWTRLGMELETEAAVGRETRFSQRALLAPHRHPSLKHTGLLERPGRSEQLHAPVAWFGIAECHHPPFELLLELSDGRVLVARQLNRNALRWATLRLGCSRFGTANGGGGQVGGHAPHDARARRGRGRDGGGRRRRGGRRSGGVGRRALRVMNEWRRLVPIERLFSGGLSLLLRLWQEHLREGRCVDGAAAGGQVDSHARGEPPPRGAMRRELAPLSARGDELGDEFEQQRGAQAGVGGRIGLRRFATQHAQRVRAAQQELVPHCGQVERRCGPQVQLDKQGHGRPASSLRSQQEQPPERLGAGERRRQRLGSQVGQLGGQLGRGAIERLGGGRGGGSMSYGSTVKRRGTVPQSQERERGGSQGGEVPLA
eukprot:scaffold4284_cov113-Isochrysis_galbana.AAC.3